MPWLDLCLVAFLAFWALGSVAFVLHVPGLLPKLERVNGSQWFVRWSLFLPGNPALRPGTFELYFRDRTGEGPASDWQLGADGHCRAWCGFFWWPERWLAMSIQNLGREVRGLLQQRPPQAAAALARARVLEAFVERRHPRSGPDVVREFRLVRRFASDGTAENVLEFRGETHAARR